MTEQEYLESLLSANSYDIMRIISLFKLYHYNIKFNKLI